MKRFESKKDMTFLAYVTSPRVHELIASGLTSQEAIAKYEQEVRVRVGGWMRSVREKHGLTQKELAVLLGYGMGGTARISEMERGKRPIPRNIRRIIEGLDSMI